MTVAGLPAMHKGKLVAAQVVTKSMTRVASSTCSVEHKVVRADFTETICLTEQVFFDFTYILITYCEYMYHNLREQYRVGL